MKSSIEDDEKPLVKIPIVPQMYLNKSCVCTPDGGFLYIGLRCVNYIASIEAMDNNPEMKVFHARQNIMGVDVDPAWGGKDGQQPRQFAILGEDNSLQIWDFKHSCPLIGHKVHTSAGRYIDGSTSRETSVLFGYMHNGNLLSMDAHDIVIYCVTSNTYCKLPSFASSRNQQLKVLACSPYNENIFAVGTLRGSVLVCDLQRKTILYTLRGHDSCITSLSWICIPKSPTKKLADNQIIEEPNKSAKLLMKSQAVEVVSVDSATVTITASEVVKVDGDDEIFDIYDYDYLEQEFGAPSASIDTTCAEFEGIEKQNSLNNCEKFDYIEACQSLKDDLKSINNDTEEQKNDDGEINTAITLAECQAAAAGIITDRSVTDSSSSSSGGSGSSICSRGEQTNTAAGSDNCGSTSSDDIIIDGVTPKHLVQILHQADVHAAQSYTLTRKPSQQSIHGDENIADNEEKKTVELGIPEKPLDDDNHHEKSLDEIVDNQHDQIVEEAPIDDDNEPKNKPKEDPLVNTFKTMTVEQADDILLVSASLDGQYWVWNTKTGGACDSMQARPVAHQQNKNSLLEVAWLNGSGFLSSNKNGNILHWVLDVNDEDDVYKFKENRKFNMPETVVHFSICPKTDVIWCTNSKRELFCKNLTSGKMLAHYSCLPTNIATLSECIDNLNHIALGCPDRRIAIIDVSSIEPKNIPIKTLSVRVGSAVTSLAWSPDCKKLAFSTVEGRIGVFNIEKPLDSPFLFHPISGKKVYSMVWKENAIYCVCNQMLAYYDPTLKKKDACIITELNEASTVAVYGNYLIVGTQSGYVKVMRRKENDTKLWYCLQNVQASKRYISDMSWSPLQKTQLAVVSNSNELIIYNINESNGLLEQTHSLDMENPKAACATVKWSYLKPNLLVTAGFDGAVRVFELVAEQIVQIYLKLYDCPIMCAMLLPTNENVLMFSGKSAALEFIDMKKVASDDYSLACSKNTKNTKSTVQWAVKMLPQVTKLSSMAEMRRQKRNSLVAETNDTLKENNTSVDINKADNISKLLENLDIGKSKEEHVNENSNESSALYLKNPNTLLYLTTKELNKDALAKLLSILNTEHCLHNKHTPTLLIAKLLGSQPQARELLAEEMRNLQSTEKAKDIAGLLMGQLNRNGLREDIINSVQNRTLNQWHISVAPTISYQFWQNCCTAFAVQLEEQGYILQAASYLLATHNQISTIDMLVRHNFFKEALLVARIYLQPNAPEFHDILDKWIEYLCSTGNISAAALICTLSGQINRAYTVLCKLRNTSPEIERALKLLKTHEQFQ